MGKETIRGGDPAAPSWEDQHPVDYRFAANAAVRAIEAQRTRPRGPTPWYLLPVPGCYDCGRSPEGVCLEHLLSRRSAVDAEALADARELDALRVEVCLLREEANVIPNDDWRATPAAIQDSWRRLTPLTDWVRTNVGASDQPRR